VWNTQTFLLALARKPQVEGSDDLNLVGIPRNLRLFDLILVGAEDRRVLARRARVGVRGRGGGCGRRRVGVLCERARAEQGEQGRGQDEVSHVRKLLNFFERVRRLRLV
jgi:hypothetical protein